MYFLSVSVNLSPLNSTSLIRGFEVGLRCRGFVESGNIPSEIISRDSSLRTGIHASDLFQLTHSSNVTPEPPKTSRALPMVRSTLPSLSRLT
jgi:hypothetical protein